jgi:hypothetical protein
LLALLLRHAESQIKPGRMSYDLRRMRLHGLIERIPKTHHYRLTALGLKTALFYTRAYQRPFCAAASAKNCVTQGGGGRTR